MALWMRQIQKTKESQTDNKQTKKGAIEKKGPAARRIDNLRINHSLKISMKSLGTQTEHIYVTHDLSSTGLFIICFNTETQPFLINSTIIDCSLELENEVSENKRINFLAKIARINSVADANEAGVTPGLGLRIIQISTSNRFLLEQYISKHAMEGEYLDHEPTHTRTAQAV